MFPKRKSHLIGCEYQCRRILRGRSADEVPAMREELKQQCAASGIVFFELPRDGDFVIGGKILPKPKKPRESWDVVRFTAGAYFTFNGERILFKHMLCYDPQAGTFQTGEGFFTLYPLPA